MLLNIKVRREKKKPENYQVQNSAVGLPELSSKDSVVSKKKRTLIYVSAYLKNYGYN